MNGSADVQRNRVNITGFICTVARLPLRRCTFDEIGSLVVALRRRWRIFHKCLRRLRLRHKTLARASGGLAGGRRLAGEDQLGRCAAEESKYYRLYLYSGKVTLAAMHLRRVRVAGRSFAAALTHLSKVVSLPATAAKKTRRGLPVALPGGGVWQENNNSADAQRNSVNITGFIYKVARSFPRRCTFDEFESLAVPSRRC
jgi:hypothetical protein